MEVLRETFLPPSREPLLRVVEVTEEWRTQIVAAQEEHVGELRPMLAANCEPSPRSAGHFRDGANVWRLQKTLAKSQMTLLTRLLDEVKALECICADTVDSVGMVLSAGRRLPPELLSLIFIEFSADLSPLAALTAPLVLGQVSSLWRAVSVATPRLWHRARLYGGSTRYDRYLDGALHLLGRAGNVPLHLEVAVSPGPHMERIWALLPRVGELHADLGHPLAPEWQLPFPAPVPHLSCARLVVPPEFPPEVFHRAVRFLAHAPKLRRFEVWGVPSVSDWGSLGIPWAQLTALELVCALDADELYDLLRACPLLEECSVPYARGTGVERALADCRALLSLSVGTPLVLACLITPRLVSLSSRCADDAEVQALLEHHTRSGFTLRSLSLVLHLRSAAVLAFIARHIHLETLSLNRQPGCGHLLHLLRHTLFPRLLRLRSVTLEGQVMQSEGRVLRTFVATALEEVAPEKRFPSLARVHLALEGFLCPADQLRLEAHVRRGFLVVDDSRVQYSDIDGVPAAPCNQSWDA